jgi:flagellar biosynthesis chaperone FliJ
MPRSARKLQRLLRVRTLQLDQVRSAEAHARAKVDEEQALRERIAALAANIAPVVESGPSFATSLIAAAHYRDRLHQTADAAERRVVAAEHGLESARAATLEARRDQNAIEKLIDREDARMVLKALRELEAMPGVPRKRHDIC